MTPDLPIHDDVAEMLRQAHQRYTAGRRRLVDVLAGGGGPMTIAQIIEGDDGLAQSSVYRNLVVLGDVGAVTRIATNDDYARYELTERLTENHHHHLICTSCGDIADFSLTDPTERTLERALTRAARNAGFEVEAHRLDLLGVCTTCR